MAYTPSNMLSLGTTAPHFNLPDTVSGHMVSLADQTSAKATLIMFICNHCPFVKHVRLELAQLARDYQPQGVTFTAISSNDVAQYPDDGPLPMKEFAEQNGFTFPYLYDEGQEVARAYQAACTPDFYVFDKNSQLAYRGQLDDARPSNQFPVNGRDIRAALNALLAGQKPEATQRPSMGCNIKWKEEVG